MWNIFALLVILGQVGSETTTRFTNVKCEVFDPSYCAFKVCELKVLGRGVVALNMHSVLLKGPFNNAKVNIGLFRRFNGYRPFLFNITFDFCKFMAKKSSVISYVKIIADALANASNINKSCPYDELLVRNLVLNEEHFKFVPLPSGEYQLQMNGATNGQWKTRFIVNFLRKEDLFKN